MTLPSSFSPQLRWFGLVLLILVAFFLRVWRLDEVPPGWRDDELIDVLVISQKALDGDIQLYYADASGNEGLYHGLNAIMYGLFGATPWGMRGLSAILGTLAIPAVYVLGKRLYDQKVGWIAAALLTVSFWSLMYSRFALRQIMTPLLALLAFICFWRAISRHRPRATRGPIYDLRLTIYDWIGTGVFLGLGFYVYFASRGVPVILLAFVVAMGVVARPRLRQIWPGLLLMAVVTFLLVAPLFIVLAQQPDAEARVSEVGVPLNRAREGDFSLVIAYTIRTLGMFHATGDDEWLYNIPFRPVFGLVGAVFFWVGVAIAVGNVVRSAWCVVRKKPMPSAFTVTLSPLFLLFWWGAGILPGFLSVPAASLGHTIVAQPATYILAALPVWAMGKLVGTRRNLGGSEQWTVDSEQSTVDSLQSPVSQSPVSHSPVSQSPVSQSPVSQSPVSQSPVSQSPVSQSPVSQSPVSHSLSLPVSQSVSILFAIILILSTAGRDLPDYFQEWPNRGMTRFLYRADISDVADYLHQHPELTDFGVAGLLAGPWDRLALEVEYGNDGVLRPRWYNAQRALMTHLGGQPALNFTGYPPELEGYAAALNPLPNATAGGYQLAQVEVTRPWQTPTCFQNGLCLVWAGYENGVLELGWDVAQTLDLPPMPLISNPPPPGVYAGPRLLVFAQLVDSQGNFLTGDDGLWVDPVTLQVGDRWLQQHFLVDEGGSAAAIFGLYDPFTGTRILTDSGQDHLRLDLPSN